MNKNDQVLHKTEQFMWISHQKQSVYLEHKVSIHDDSTVSTTIPKLIVANNYFKINQKAKQIACSGHPTTPLHQYGIARS